MCENLKTRNFSTINHPFWSPKHLFAPVESHVLRQPQNMKTNYEPVVLRDDFARAWEICSVDPVVVPVPLFAGRSDRVATVLRLFSTPLDHLNFSGSPGKVLTTLMCLFMTLGRARLKDYPDINHLVHLIVNCAHQGSVARLEGFGKTVGERERGA